MKFRGGMGELVRQASRLQRKVDKRKEELAADTVEAGAGNDTVKAVVNGARKLVRVAIDPELFKTEDPAMLQDLVVVAVNAALEKSEQMVDAEIEKVTGGLKLPGAF